MIRILMAIAAVTLVLAGCTTSSGHYVSWYGESGWTDIDNGGFGWRWPDSFIVTRTCPANYACMRVRVVHENEPPNDEAFSFVFKTKVRATVGIPYGEYANTVYVIGPRERCLSAAEAHRLRAGGPTHEGNGHLSDNSAELCAGPVWIRAAVE